MTITIDGSNGITYPAGTIQGTGYGPAFSAYCNTSQSLTGTVYTKLQLNTELFDTANCFDSTTNYRFTPNVAGYYQFNGYCQVNSAATLWYVNIYKNGSINNYGSYTGASGNALVSNVSNIIYMNGTTDYIEFYVYSSASASVVGSLTSNGFSGVLIRGA
jgi:hypothetical protein